jgi:hypothetical protein
MLVVALSNMYPCGVQCVRTSQHQTWNALRKFSSYCYSTSPLPLPLLCLCRAWRKVDLEHYKFQDALKLRREALKEDVAEVREGLGAVETRTTSSCSGLVCQAWL